MRNFLKSLWEDKMGWVFILGFNVLGYMLLLAQDVSLTISLGVAFVQLSTLIFVIEMVKRDG